MLDGNETGVRLEGFRGEANVGNIIEIQYRREHAMFRIVWIRTQEEYLVGGVLGIAVAISRGRWWWGFGLWGTIVTAWGVLGATVPFWAK
jgi:hypothetical protein